MLQLADRPSAFEGDRPLPDMVRAFLIESEGRVLLHCHKLPSQENLPAEERDSLMRLASRAEQELRRLAA